MIVYVNHTRTKAGLKGRTYHVRRDCPVIRRTPESQIVRMELGEWPLGGPCWVCGYWIGHGMEPERRRRPD